MAVNAAVGQKPVKVELFTVFKCGIDSVVEFFVFKEVAVLYLFCDTGKFLINYAPRADVKVTYLAVTHLPVGEPYRKPARAQKRGGIFFVKF